VIVTTDDPYDDDDDIDNNNNNKLTNGKKHVIGQSGLQSMQNERSVAVSFGDMLPLLLLPMLVLSQLLLL
jgi:hypothetical protein